MVSQQVDPRGQLARAMDRTSRFLEDVRREKQPVEAESPRELRIVLDPESIASAMSTIAMDDINDGGDENLSQFSNDR